MKKVTIVTISYNQVKYIDNCIKSVLEQDYENIEYIIVDAGSEDGSRELIDSYGDKVIKIFEADRGPADGLNKGFSLATGDIFGYLNSDDFLEPNAIKYVVDFFKINQKYDVISGNSFIVNESGSILRNFYSDKMHLNKYAYQGVILSQPSTFFKKKIYQDTGGFNIENKSNWDGELICDMAINGGRFTNVNKFLSSYRLQPLSITSSGSLNNLHNIHLEKMFHKIKNRKVTKFDRILIFYYKLLRKLLNPKDTLHRIMYGPIYRKSGV